jgi:hypothetical protein
MTRIRALSVCAVSVFALAGCTSPPAELTVPTPIAVELTVTGVQVITELGRTEPFTATIRMSTGESVSVTEAVVWESTDRAVLTVSPKGGVVALAAGSAFISARYQLLTTAVQVAVRPQPAAL